MGICRFSFGSMVFFWWGGFISSLGPFKMGETSRGQELCMQLSSKSKIILFLFAFVSHNC